MGIARPPVGGLSVTGQRLGDDGLGDSSHRQDCVAVIGPSEAGQDLLDLAHDVGVLLARSGIVTLTGGLATGVMGEVARGVHEQGGICVGILPDFDARLASKYLDVSLTTGLHELRNGLLVNSARAIIAIGGGWGTLTEIALALRQGKAVVCLKSWEPNPPEGSAFQGVPTIVETPAQAVDTVIRAMRGPGNRRLALWLEPEDPQLPRQIIDYAAGICRTRPFEPHLTLATCSDLNPDEIVAAGRRIAGRLRATTFVPNGFALRDDDPHHALMVLAAVTPELQVAQSLVRHELPQAELENMPHISILYGSPSLKMRLSVLEGSIELLSSVELGHLTVRDTSDPDHARWGEPIASWRLRPAGS
jgi:uncharacterized protein (TIGR00725 family)